MLNNHMDLLYPWARWTRKTLLSESAIDSVVTSFSLLSLDTHPSLWSSVSLLTSVSRRSWRSCCVQAGDARVAVEAKVFSGRSRHSLRTGVSLLTDKGDSHLSLFSFITGHSRAAL